MATPKFSRPVVIRLHPEPGSSLFCRVNVWQDKAEMMAYFRRDRGRRFADANMVAAATATGIERYRVVPGMRMRKTGEFCEINCHRENLTEEIVSHEVAHAALRWRSRVAVAIDHGDDAEHEDVSDGEERFCYALGRMVGELSRKLRRHKVWPRPVAAPAADN